MQSHSVLPCGRKKRLILFMLLLCGIPLFAQTSREAKIFVPPVTGGSHDDASFFYRQLTYEVVLQYYALVRTRQGSDFALKSSIRPYTGEDITGALKEKQIVRAVEIIENYNSGLNNSGENVFSLELIDGATGETIGEQYLVYSSIKDPSVAALVSEVVHNLLSGIPDIDETENWRNKWLFIGISGMWTPRVYMGQQQSVNWANGGLGLQAEFHFLNFMSANVELQFVPDWIVVSQTAKEEYIDVLLEIPLSLKYVFKPLGYFMLEPYAGVSFNISLMGETQPSLCSWFAGLQFGVKAGPGAITIDPRFSMDFTESVIPAKKIPYARTLIQIAAGYKMGFFTKKPQSK